MQRSNPLELLDSLSMRLLRTNRNLVPVIPLATLSIYTIFVVLSVPVYQDGEAYSRAFTIAHYGAFAAVLLLLSTYFSYRQLFKPLLLLTLTLTLLGIINFLPVSARFNIGFGDAGIGFSILGLALMVWYYFLNRSAAHAVIRKNLFPAPTPKKAAMNKRESIDRFKKNFARKSTESLLLMVQERKVLPLALAAAQELLEERQITASNS